MTSSGLLPRIWAFKLHQACTMLEVSTIESLHSITSTSLMVLHTDCGKLPKPIDAGCHYGKGAEMPLALAKIWDIKVMSRYKWV